jgi:antitoxin VapB
MQKAKLFMNGQSQAVRLPKEFRMPGKEVRISRCGKGVLIEPIEESFDALFRSLDEFSDDFMSSGRQQPTMPSRESL